MPDCRDARPVAPGDRWFAWLPAVAVFVTLESLVAAQAVFAYRGSFLTVAQMRTMGVPYGLPFLWHFGMWSDFMVISPLAAYLAGRYATRWKVTRVVLSLAAGFLLAAVLSFVYTTSAIPEAHVLNHRLTPAGYVHAVYMAAVVAVFIQFFLFTPAIPGAVLTGVSILMVLHVIVGTHMTLGFLGIMVPLDWYPGRPLTSIFGWATVVILATALLWRRLLLPPVRHETSRSVAKRLAHFFMYWIEDDIYWRPEAIHTPRGLLRFLDSAGGHILEVGFFAGAAWTAWRRSACPAYMPLDPRFSLGCVATAIASCLLVLLFGAVYRLSRRSVKVELAIAQRLFPPDHVPAQWGRPRDPVGITLTVLGFFLLYMALAWLASDIRLVTLIMVGIASIDFNTRRLIGNRIAAYFADNRYAPRPGDQNREAIEKSRDVVWEYLSIKPHLLKEGGRVAGCVIAFALAMSGYLRGAALMTLLAYLGLMGTLIINEIVTWRWRAERDRRLIAVELGNSAAVPSTSE